MVFISLQQILAQSINETKIKSQFLSCYTLKIRIKDIL